MTPEEQIRDIVFDVLHPFAADVVDDLHQRLDQSYPPASSPGQSPHRRSGDLQGGIDYLITDEGPIITLTVVSSMPYSAPLEFGAGKRNLAPRPFMAPTLQSWTPELIRRLQAAFSGPSPVMSPAGAIVPVFPVAA